jgi:acetate---CoA ligase (ADP-forming)
LLAQQWSGPPLPTATMTEARAPDPLDRLFRPRSIAIVGASSNPAKIGGVPLALLQRMGYEGAIHPVNPGAAELQGLRCHARIADIGAPVDLAIIALPAALAEAALIEAADAGVAGAVLFSSGYAEVGEAGRAAQQRLADIARGRGIRLLGPNCLGFMSPREKVYATFSPAPLGGVAQAGPIGLVSQSGAFGIYAYVMARERGLGLSQWVSTGNECDLQVADIVAWLARDAHTQVILVYLEGCRDGPRLRAALELARAAGKPAVVTKVGRSAAGAQAAASHTASLAGDDAVFDALLRQCGARRTHTLDDFFNAGYVLSRSPRPARPGVGIMTISGGVGALMADDAHDCGLQLPELPADAQARILARVPFAAPRNPVDITGQVVAEPELMAFAAQQMIDSGCYGSLLGFFAGAGTSPTVGPKVLEWARLLRAEHPQLPLALCALFPPDSRQALEALRCLVFSDPSAAVRALRVLASTAEAAAPLAMLDAPPPRRLPPGALNELDSLALLHEAGLPVLPAQAAADADAAVAAAQRLGYPVVLKLLSAEVLHKSDVGGVRLNLRDADVVRAAHAAILADAARLAPGASIDGVLVAPMLAEPGVECILGVQRDPAYGPVVMVGLGGVLVEVHRDVSFRIAPFGRNDALAMIDELRGRRLLDAHRGRAAVDLGALADALVALSRLAVSAGDTLDSIDINPFVVLPRGAVALDAVVMGRKEPTDG